MKPGDYVERSMFLSDIDPFFSHPAVSNDLVGIATHNNYGEMERAAN